MYKVVRFTPGKTISASTSTSLFDKISEPGRPEEDVKGGFMTKSDAEEFITARHRSNPMSEWSYRVEEE